MTDQAHTEQSDSLVTRADLNEAFRLMEGTDSPEEMGMAQVELVEWLEETLLGTDGHPDSHDFNLGIVCGLGIGVMAERIRARRCSRS